MNTFSTANQRTTVAGIACLAIAAGLFGGACSWLGVTLLIGHLAGPPTTLPGIAYVAGFAQIAVSLLLAAAGIMFLRRSRRAKVLLWLAIGSFVVELPLFMLALVGLMTATR